MSSVSGFEDLDKVFRELKKGMANRIARPGLTKAGRLAVRKIKATIPSRFKDIRKAIKSRSIKTKYNGGFAGNKVGAGVSRKKETQKKSRDGRKGVGIGARNVHWWFVGTAERRTKAGKRTGRMPKQAVSVSVIVGAARTEISAILKTNIEAGIEKEAARLAKKRL